MNEVLESETHQQQQHGRVASRGHKEWRHSTHRINPDTGKPEEGKFVRVVNAHGITGSTILTVVWWRSWSIKVAIALSSGVTNGIHAAS
ncbi:hypothetical protein [Shigella flexneri]|uniref:hypothetical protein n=1 Tax=Shigella flexneri TaxID=623 RepID=UPI0025413179|nr:hypothetical protein [Shigella flexneri]